MSSQRIERPEGVASRTESAHGERDGAGLFVFPIAVGVGFGLGVLAATVFRAVRLASDGAARADGLVNDNHLRSLMFHIMPRRRPL